MLEQCWGSEALFMKAQLFIMLSSVLHELTKRECLLKVQMMHTSCHKSDTCNKLLAGLAKRSMLKCSQWFLKWKFSHLQHCFKQIISGVWGQLLLLFFFNCLSWDWCASFSSNVLRMCGVQQNREAKRTRVRVSYLAWWMVKQRS